MRERIELLVGLISVTWINLSYGLVLYLLLSAAIKILKT